MARPRKRPQDTRSETLAIRLTPAERLSLEQAAIAAGLSTSAYARRRVLGGPVPARRADGIDPALFDQLRRIGVNLNQLTRLAHIKGRMPYELGTVCATLDRVLKQVLEGDLAPAEESERRESAGPASAQS